MKRLILPTLLLAVPLFAELSVKRIDAMVEQIQGKRSSEVKVDFEKVASPFARVVTSKDDNTTPIMKTVEESVDFRLGAIINDRARINGKWVGVGESIQGYKVETIEADRVVLKKSKRTVELFLPDPDKSKLLQINEG